MYDLTCYKQSFSLFSETERQQEQECTRLQTYRERVSVKREEDKVRYYTVVLQLLHCCYAVATLLLNFCYTVATLLLHCCHTVVTLKVREKLEEAGMDSMQVCSFYNYFWIKFASCKLQSS
jgi:hypothetical protein